MRALRRPYLTLLGASTLVLAVAVAFVSWRLRSGLREQTLRREAAAVHASIIWQRALENERVGTLGLTPDDQEFAMLALAASRLPNVIGSEAFSLAGRPITGLGPALSLGAPTTEEWSALRKLEPIARLRDDGAALEITVPLHGPDSTVLEGALRFLLDAAPLRRELAQLDARLWQQGFGVWFSTSLVLAVTLAWVFRRLARAEAALLARTADLEHANRELTFAAKTSALGAITAHLVHGLRNPVAGLAGFESTDSADPSTLREASAAARRIRQMVEQTVALLRDENSGATHDVSATDLVASLAREFADTARARGIVLECAADADLTIDNRRAALCLAILRDLARNATEALEPGGRLVLRTMRSDREFVFSVEDDGPGIPSHIKAHLFEPTRSTKPGGAGIGLAISRRLAEHLGARLDHDAPGSRGARFRLALACAPEARA